MSSDTTALTAYTGDSERVVWQHSRIGRVWPLPYGWQISFPHEGGYWFMVLNNGETLQPKSPEPHIGDAVSWVYKGIGYPYGMSAFVLGEYRVW